MEELCVYADVPCDDCGGCGKPPNVKEDEEKKKEKEDDRKD